MVDGLQTLVDELVSSGDVTAASALIGDAERVRGRARSGWRDRDSGLRIRRWDRFDYASLTKPWIATLALGLHHRSILALETEIGSLWGEAPERLAHRSLEDLLRHRSGLLPWRPFFRHLRRADGLVRRILREDTLGAPPGTYSDIGYALWARAAEEATGSGLSDLLGRYVLGPLGVTSVGFRPPPAGAVGVLLGNDREVELARSLGVAVAFEPGPAVGTVQDGNARFLGGAAGHAGLFGTAEALWRLGAEWSNPRRVLTPGLRRRALDGRGRYRTGWWMRSAATRATRALGAGSFGHHGFTGGSLWVDPRRGAVIVLLAHRSDVSVDLDPWRARLHRMATR